MTTHTIARKKWRLILFPLQINTIITLYKQVKKKIIESVVLQVAVWIARYRMKVGIAGVTSLHIFLAKKGKYLDSDNRVLRQYIVLLEMPVRNKKGQLRLKEKVWWVNRNNFKKIKRQGWLPKNMYIDQLRKKAFYISNPTRSYQQEYAAKEYAINKYLTYVKAQFQP